MNRFFEQDGENDFIGMTVGSLWFAIECNSQVVEINSINFLYKVIHF